MEQNVCVTTIRTYTVRLNLNLVGFHFHKYAKIAHRDVDTEQKKHPGNWKL